MPVVRLLSQIFPLSLRHVAYLLCWEQLIDGQLVGAHWGLARCRRAAIHQLLQFHVSAGYL